MKNKGTKSGTQVMSGKLIFYIFSAVILLWTASLTVSFLTNALPGAFWLVPYVGLVIFDVGMIAWLYVYLHNAEGSMQRAIAIGLTIVNLIGVGLITISEILLGGQTLAAAPENLGTAAIWGIGIWTFINVAAVVGYHLSSPAARLAAQLQDEKDAIYDAALDHVRESREQHAKRIGGEIGERMYRAMVSEMGADADGDGIPDLLERPDNRGRAAESIMAEEETPARPFQNGQPGKSRNLSRPE